MTNQGFFEIDEIDFLNLIKKLSADHISEYDYVIVSEKNTFFECGEVPLEKGHRADTCHFHPVYIARVEAESLFDDRLTSDTENLLNDLIETFVNDCSPCDPETALDVAETFFSTLPYNTDIETILDYINWEFDDDDDAMTRDDIRNVIAEKLTENN